MIEITSEMLAKWKALCDAATPGPWRPSIGEEAGFIHSCGPDFPWELDTVDASAQADADFIAEARTAMPALIAEVERLRERLLEYEPAPRGPGVFGQKGVRDPDHPCDVFNPGEPSGQCQSDGHYLCHECSELDPERKDGEAGR